MKLHYLPSKLFWSLAVLLSIWSCTESEPNTVVHVPADLSSYDFVSTSYFRDTQNTNWCALKLRIAGPDVLSFSLRSSRSADSSSQCKMDGLAYKLDENIFKFYIHQKEVHIIFHDSTLQLRTADSADADFMKTISSNQDLIRGEFRLVKNLDPSRIDPTAYYRLLYREGYIVEVQSEQGKLLSIKYQDSTRTEKFESIQIPERHALMGTDADDLNGDGLPEILIYLQSTDVRRIGNVAGISLTAEGSELLNFKETKTNQAINSGYRGQDEFKLVEHTLVQRFPIYLDDDPDSLARGGFRQIAYKLEGEGDAQFFQITASNKIQK